MQPRSNPYVIGVMKIPVEERDPEFSAMVDRAVEAVDRRLRQGKAHLTIKVDEFLGPHLSPVEGARAATSLSLLATMLVLYGFFFTLTLVGSLTFFPDALQEEWPSVKPATRLMDQVQIGMFLAAMGVLAGSLGGGAERRDLIRHVLFLDEEAERGGWSAPPATRRA